MRRAEWLERALDHIETDDCLLWPFRCNTRYPVLKYEGRDRYVHQVVWLLTRGELPSEPLELRHLCGHALCFNPDHLATGTHVENEADKDRYGTRNRAPAAKLTEDQVRAIRSDPTAASKLAQVYGVWPETIRDIRGFRTWTHVA
jgi:HNH endonuclease